MRGAVRGASLAGTAAAVAVLASLAANAATSHDRWPGALDRIRQQPWWWVAGLAAVGVLVAVVIAWRQERGAAVAGDPPAPAPRAVPDWVVDRGERARTVKAVCRAGRPRRRRTAAVPTSLEAPRRFGRLRRARARARADRGSRTVALTTSLEGAGGFGKTVLAHAVAASPRVRRYFRGRVYTVTIGRDVRGRAAIAAKVAEATRFLTGDTTAFDDPGLAGDHLGRLLDLRPRTLLILDDVWDAEQLEPFLRAGERCVRLVTTRVPGALPRGTERVRVDEMSPDQARAVLTWELPELPETLVRDLLEATGRWALLLRLTNRLITRRIATGTAPEDAAAEALRDLVANGPAVVDADPAALDLDDPVRRARAVRATVEAARTLLPPGGDRRLAELAVFAEDESVPVPLIARLWEATGGLTEQATRSLCGELDRLSLVSLTAEHGGRITMHDVLRDYLLKELDEADAAALHGTVADAAGAGPWEPPEDSRGYLLDHMIEHLLAAGRTPEAERVASDLRWIETRLHQRGPMAAWADLAAVPTRTAARLADDLTRTAHLLTPTDPPELLTNVLHSRLESLPLWGEAFARRRTGSPPRPELRNRRTPPDLPDPALLRTFHGHTGPVWSVAVSSTGSLVTIGADGMARGLDPNSGGRLTLDIRGADRFRVLAVSPGGDRIATAGPDRTVRLWSPDPGTPPQHTLGPIGDRGTSVRAVAVSGAHEGARIATVASDGTLDVWHADTGEHLASAKRWDETTCVAFAPNGRWLAFGGRQGVLSMTADLVRERTRVPTISSPVNALAIVPDGSRIVSAEADGALRIWNETPPYDVSQISAHRGPATAVAIAPDGTWAVSGGADGTVAVWDLRTHSCRARYTTHSGRVHAVAVAPDGDRLISTGEDGTVKVWDSAGPQWIGSGDGEGMRSVTIVGDSGRVAVTDGDGRTRLYDPRDDTWDSPLSSRIGDDYQGPIVFDPGGGRYAVGHLYRVEVGRLGRAAGTDHAVLRLGHPVWAQAVALSPDGAWVAVAGSDGALQLWDRVPERRTVTLPGPWGAESRAHAVVIAPDGTWLAVLRSRPRSGPAGFESLVRVLRPGPERRSAGHPVDISQDGTLTTLTVTPDGTHLVTASATGAVTFWDPHTGTRVASFTDPDGPVNALSVSPDGCWIATAGTMLRVWDAATGRTVAGVRAETPLSSCAWLPDGRGLVAVGERGLYSYEFVPGPRL
ncbi:NB-ARC domain-containing protein [Streptomyces sp. NPDC126499]|uniref:NB-ARC domain-containing protein n=1 Tax=Streptomyces sp. NPDC126499 TaxID=3155314 RepID=UPI0033278015